MTGWLTDEMEDHIITFIFAASFLGFVIFASVKSEAPYTPTPADIQDAITHDDAPIQDAHTEELLSILDRVTMVYTVGRVTTMEFCRGGVGEQRWYWSFELNDGSIIVLLAVNCRSA